MSRYIRTQPIIRKDTENDWAEQFESNLEKSAVQPKRVDDSLFNQINSIMNGKSKHTSVAAAVEDMKERSGLTAYLNKLNKVSEEEDIDSNKKTASKKEEVKDFTPVVIKKFPTIKNTIENHIRDTKGNLSIPAIIEKIKSIHQKDVSDSADWEDERLIFFVSKLNLDAKKNNPTHEVSINLGRKSVNDSDTDPSNTDAFHVLMPFKG